MTERIEPIHPGEIIRGKRSITVDTALRFSKFLERHQNYIRFIHSNSMILKYFK